MNETTRMSNNGGTAGGPGKLKEGFQPMEPAPAVVEVQPSPPQANPPQQPLPSQLKNEPPQLEPALSEFDQIRRDISETAEAWPIRVELLYRPIRNEKGEEVRVLTFREPRASEINRIGNPTRMLWDGEIIIEERKMTHIMAALSGILPPLLEAMDPRDWNSCAYRLRKFFLPDLRAW